MDPIVAEWRQSTSAASAKALADWRSLSAHLVAKHSTPYQPTSPHDFLHHKVIVTEGVVATGSYNISANAEHNAENHLAIALPAIADRYAAQIATLATAYGHDAPD